MRNSIARVIVVTGGANGIGLAMVRALLRCGHFVVAVDTNEAALQALRKERRQAGHVLALCSDLATESGCNECISRAAAYYGRVDGVINNAGIGVSSIRADAERLHPSIEELTTEIWDRFFLINVRAAMLVLRAALPFMKQGRWGRVINVTTSYRTMLRLLPYGATKSALEAMSAVWANELRGSGITVNVLVPGGPTDTALIAEESGWPRKNLLSPEIMGPPVCWLVSNGANEFSGRRVTAKKWDPVLPPNQAAENASRSIGWPELADPPATWQL